MAKSVYDSISTTAYGVTTGLAVTGNETLSIDDCYPHLVTSDTSTLSLPTSGLQGHPPIHIVSDRANQVITISPGGSQQIRFNGSGITAANGKDIIWTTNDGGRSLVIAGWGTSAWEVVHFDDDISKVSREA